MGDMLSYYKQAKANGWLAPRYKAKVTFIDNEQFTIWLQGTWYDLIRYALMYSYYSIPNEWKLYENNKPVSAEVMWDFVQSVQLLRK